MLRKALITRIERLEQAAKAQSKHPTECICFPANEPPFFGFPIEQQIAAKVKCPLHGERFKSLFHLFVPGWRRENEKKRVLSLASSTTKHGTPASRPTCDRQKKSRLIDGRIFLKLKDGTKILAYEPAYSSPINR